MKFTNPPEFPPPLYPFEAPPFTNPPEEPPLTNPPDDPPFTNHLKGYFSKELPLF